MSSRNVGRALAMLALSLTLPSCNHKNKAEQLAALDEAYRSGVLTKEEYDAKRAAIAGPAPPAPAPAPAASPAPVAPQPAPVAALPTDRSGAGSMPHTSPAASNPESTSGSKVPEPSPPAVVNPAPPGKPKAAEPKVAESKVTEPKAAEPPEEEPAPLAGCEDAEYQAGKEKGPKERFFPDERTRVKRAAIKALASLDFNIHKNAASEIEASKRRHIGVLVGKGGEHVILHFQESQRDGQKGTLVTGETKKAFVGRLGQKSWTNAVLAQTACMLREGTR